MFCEVSCLVIKPLKFVIVEHHKIVDDNFLLFIQLRKMGLLKKEDIRSYGLLLNRLFYYKYFAKKASFCFSIEWDPSALAHPDSFGSILIHDGTHKSSIRGFTSLFEAGIRYFPKNGISFLFHINSNDETAFQRACKNYERDEVMKVVEETIIRYSSYSDNNNTSPLNIVEALISAAIDKNIDLDCVYFLLLRQPDLLVGLLSSTPAVAAAMTGSKNNNNEDGDRDERNDGNSNALDTRELNSSQNRKREL